MALLYFDEFFYRNIIEMWSETRVKVRKAELFHSIQKKKYEKIAFYSPFKIEHYLNRVKAQLCRKIVILIGWTISDK